MVGGAVARGYLLAVAVGGEADGVSVIVGLDGDCGGLAHGVVDGESNGLNHGVVDGITVSWTVSLWVCCVTVLLLLQLTVNRASVAMRAVVNPLYCIA